MASAAPAKHNKPRQPVQEPTHKDHNIMPSAKITPTAI
jgi:hypothetical protein